MWDGNNMSVSTTALIDVSIIIVNYNSVELLNNCLNSIYKHSDGFKYEIIVVDNGSTNFHESDLKKNENTRIIINGVNLGFSKANNIALDQAKGRYTLILNNDTIFLENSIKRLIEFSEKDSVRKLIGIQLLNENRSFQQSVFRTPGVLNLLSSTLFLDQLFPRYQRFSKYDLRAEKVNTTIEVDSMIGAFLFAETSALKEIGGFDENYFFYHEDTDLCKRFSEKIGKVLYFPSTSIIHIGGATTADYNWFREKNKALSRRTFVKNHFGLFSKILLFIILYAGLILRIPLFLLIGIFTLNKMYLLKSFYNFRLLFI